MIDFHTRECAGCAGTERFSAVFCELCGGAGCFLTEGTRAGDPAVRRRASLIDALKIAGTALAAAVAAMLIAAHRLGLLP